MGADPSTFSAMFKHLAKTFHKAPLEVQLDRKVIARALRRISEPEDFNDDDLDCYEELFILGLAKRCKHCQKAYTDWSSDRHGEGVCT